MMAHYFKEDKQLAHEFRDITFYSPAGRLTFTTDRGVFSKDQIDYGSVTLIKTIVDTQKNLTTETIVELGSGYGPIAISLAATYPKTQIIGYEVNERARQLSIKNAEKNQVNNVEFQQADLMEYTLPEESAEYVVTNPPIRAGKAVVQRFVELAYVSLKSNGTLYVVIQKKQGAPSMMRFMQQVFGNVEKIKQDKGYWILCSCKK